MNDHKILVAVDFTPATENALQLASLIAKKLKMDITLLHVEHKGSDAAKKLEELAAKITSEQGIACDYLLARGSIFTEIPKVACEECFKLMILGSHGYKGFREKFLGSDILKLMKRTTVPALVVQLGFKIPADGIKTIVLPAGTHKTFPGIIEATAFMAGVFDAEVHIYTVEKLALEWSDELIANIELAKKVFEEKHIHYKRVNEKQTTFALGYAKQILKYATENHADIIAVMSIPTPEHYYFADSDKELLLTNEACIPILCTSGLK